MFFLEIENCVILLMCLFPSPLCSALIDGTLRNSQSDSYRRSFPFRWIFKIFPSLCLAVAMPFFSRLAADNENTVSVL